MKPKTIAGLEPGDHLCCLYEKEEEHRALMTPLLRRGLERGHKVLYIADVHTAEVVLGYLRDDGLAVEPYLASGQLAILTAAETYLRDGFFDPERMIALLQAETERALAEGYTALRATGEMTWMLRGRPASERLIEYEVDLNTFLPGSRCLAICQYDRRRFAPALLLDVLTVHPLVVAGTGVHENLYYIPPEEYRSTDRAAAELRHRLENLDRWKAISEARTQERDTLQTVIENIGAHLAYLDPALRFIWVNSAYAHATGYTPQELLGRNYFDLFPRSEERDIFERVLKSGQPVTFTARPFEFPGHPDQAGTYWDWALVPVKDETGAVEGLVLSLTDVTQQERIRAVLGQYTSRLQIQHEIDLAILGARSLAETANIVLDYILRLVPCRRASLAILEAQAERALLIAVRSQGESLLSEGTTVPLSAVPFLEELQQGRAHLIADLQEIEDLPPPFRQLRREGVRGYLSIPLMEEEELVGAINIGLDRPADSAPASWDLLQELAPALAVAVQHARLHEEVRRYAAELEERVARRTAELLASQQNYQALVNSIDGIVWELDVATFRFLFVSQQAERLLGYPVERWLSEPTFWQDHLHPEDREWAIAFCAQATAEKRDHEFEYRMLAADGRTVWLRDIVTVVLENDQPVRLRGIMVDITAQKAMQAALLQNERLAAMGRLAATVAHEINNPLQSVVGCLDLAEEGRAEGRDIGRYLEVAREEVQRLRRIVGQMRELYRPEAGEREPADLNRLVEEVLVLCDQPCRDGRIALDWRPAADLPPVAVAADRIKQVFLNLLLNAIEAMPEGGPLCVRTVRSEQPAGIRIEFQDSGIGIAPEALPRLFEPFYSTKPKGSGLGLFVSYRIVQEHGGTITVDSRPGEGSTFTVWLPLESVQPRGSASQD